jgi:hypothetical protein
MALVCQNAYYSTRTSAEFVVCNRNSSIVAVIELDYGSHKKADRQVADAEKGKLPHRRDPISPLSESL